MAAINRLELGPWKQEAIGTDSGISLELGYVRFSGLYGKCAFGLDQ